MRESEKPLLLVVDDLFGRRHPTGVNEERLDLCGQLLLHDVTGDQDEAGRRQQVRNPVADVVFCRGQTPEAATIGDEVRNDPDLVLRVVRSRWNAPVQRRWALVLVDLCFYTGRITPESNARQSGIPEGSPEDEAPDRYFGIALLELLRRDFPELPVAVLSSKPKDPVSLPYARAGALGFLQRGDTVDPEDLRSLIRRFALVPDPSGGILGHSPALLIALRSARRSAATGNNSLMRGETGTGKDLLAAYIHAQAVDAGSMAPNAPFVTVNSGGLAEELYYSELFGSLRGSFTGAIDRPGKIAEADGGDVFLDEIGNLPEKVAQGLLRVTETGEVQPYGARLRQHLNVKVRFLSATNAPLEQMVTDGSFREDLYERLTAGGIVFLPPLRRRVEDIPLLARAFVQDAERTVPGAVRREIHPETMAFLQSCPWPRNVRQLRNSLRRAVASYPYVEHLLPQHVQGTDATDSEAVLGAEEPAAVPLPAPRPAGLTGDAPSVQRLIESLSRFDFTRRDTSELQGILPQLEEACGRLLAGCLKAGLGAFRRPDDDEIMVQRALRYLVGNNALTATKAYDTVKRIIKLSKSTKQELLQDPLLKGAFDRSQRARSTKK